MAPEKNIPDFKSQKNEFNRQMKEIDEKYEKGKELEDLKKEIIDGPRKQVLEIRTKLKDLENRLKKLSRNHPERDAVQRAYDAGQELYKQMNAQMADLRDGDIDNDYDALDNGEIGPAPREDTPAKPAPTPQEPKAPEKADKTKSWLPEKLPTQYTKKEIEAYLKEVQERTDFAFTYEVKTNTSGDLKGVIMKKRIIDDYWDPQEAKAEDDPDPNAEQITLEITFDSRSKTFSLPGEQRNLKLGHAAILANVINASRIQSWTINPHATSFEEDALGKMPHPVSQMFLVEKRRKGEEKQGMDARMISLGSGENSARRGFLQLSEKGSDKNKQSYQNYVDLGFSDTELVESFNEQFVSDLQSFPEKEAPIRVDSRYMYVEKIAPTGRPFHLLTDRTGKPMFIGDYQNHHGTIGFLVNNKWQFLDPNKKWIEMDSKKEFQGARSLYKNIVEVQHMDDTWSVRDSEGKWVRHKGKNKFQDVDSDQWGSIRVSHSETEFARREPNGNWLRFEGEEIFQLTLKRHGVTTARHKGGVSIWNGTEWVQKDGKNTFYNARIYPSGTLTIQPTPEQENDTVRLTNGTWLEDVKDVKEKHWQGNQGVTITFKDYAKLFVQPDGEILKLGDTERFKEINYSSDGSAKVTHLDDSASYRNKDGSWLESIDGGKRFKTVDGERVQNLDDSWSVKNSEGEWLEFNGKKGFLEISVLDEYDKSFIVTHLDGKISILGRNERWANYDGVKKFGVVKKAGKTALVQHSDGLWSARVGNANHWADYQGTRKFSDTLFDEESDSIGLKHPDGRWSTHSGIYNGEEWIEVEDGKRFDSLKIEGDKFIGTIGSKKYSRRMSTYSNWEEVEE